VKALLAAVAAVVLVVAALLGTPWPAELRLTIHLISAAGLYAGSDVRVLGVRVGRVVEVRPEAASVRVELAYDRRHPAPADAVAAVVQPTLVGDRYVQLAPAYAGGPALADGADLPVARTATPAEPDDIVRALDELGTALGPSGANRSGALARLVSTGRRNLDGNGDALHGVLAQVSRLGQGAGGDTAATIGQLQRITAALAASDGQVRDFAADLASVGAQLDGEKDDLGAAVRALTDALTQLAAFVRENGAALRGNVRALTELTAVLVRQKQTLAAILDAAPAALASLQRAYDPATGALVVRDAGRDCAPRPACHQAPTPTAAAPEPARATTLADLLGATP
jgi:phospholipid/cholesterol/gamma-HCH transport system substrate-binding protein